MTVRLLLITALSALLVQCSPSGTIGQAPSEPITDPVVEVPSEDWASAHLREKMLFLDDYNATPDLHWKVLHTRLDISPDWETQTLQGTANLTLTPHFYPDTVIELDARAFLIDEIVLAGAERKLTFTYDSLKLRIHLKETVTRSDTIQLRIRYTARPNEYARMSGSPRGKGLFFINPLDTDPDKPRQLWTQGQMYGSANWFPTIDHPNQRHTQEIVLTVEEGFTTLSNGYLASSITRDGNRTDTWRIDQSHPIYLTMIAAGPFDIVRDTVRGVPLLYYMEPEWAPHAKTIFAATGPMLELYEDVLGVPFPWPQYAQIVVRDFVAGGMENTGATVLYEQMNTDDRALLDRNFEGLIAHEIIHQWFGDLVTCESWPQLALNESFASFGEQMWMEAAYGQDFEQLNVQTATERYLGEAQRAQGTIVRYKVANHYHMFNRHTYQKGALVLRHLKHYLGNDAFYRSLNLFLTRYAHQAVDLHHLRLVFEEVSGKDLLWFFDQWFLTPGHPVLTMQYRDTVIARMPAVAVSISQRHSVSPGIYYRLPISIYTHNGEITQKHTFTFHSGDSVFHFPGNFDAISVEPHRSVPAVYRDLKPEAWHLYHIKQGTYFQRRAAMEWFAEAPDAFQEQLLEAATDTFWRIREDALMLLDPTVNADAVKERISQLALTDPKASVRALAVLRIQNFSDGDVVAVLRQAANDPSYAVVAEAIQGLVYHDARAAIRHAIPLENAPSISLRKAILHVYAISGEPGKLAYFGDSYDMLAEPADRFEWLQNLAGYMGHFDEADVALEGMRQLHHAGKLDPAQVVRQHAYSTLKRVLMPWEERLDLLQEIDPNGTDTQSAGAVVSEGNRLLQDLIRPAQEERLITD